MDVDGRSIASVDRKKKEEKRKRKKKKMEEQAREEEQIDGRGIWRAQISGARMLMGEGGGVRAFDPLYLE